MEHYVGKPKSPPGYSDKNLIRTIIANSVNLNAKCNTKDNMCKHMYSICQDEPCKSCDITNNWKNYTPIEYTPKESIFTLFNTIKKES